VCSAVQGEGEGTRGVLFISRTSLVRSLSQLLEVPALCNAGTPSWQAKRASRGGGGCAMPPPRCAWFAQSLAGVKTNNPCY
jgi:hypothetical protein